MDDQQLLRYSRHILLAEFGLEAQQRISNASVLVVGAGGLGAGALPYLASAGIGRLTIADGDVVDLTNLQRQVVHREATIGHNKAKSATVALRELNSTINVVAVERRVEGAELNQLVGAADLVLDCSDNFATRHAINAACLKHQNKLVSGAAIRFDGQLACFDFSNPTSPCYACLFPEVPDAAEAGEDRCGVMGVFAPLVGVIGAMQAAEAIRMLAGVGESSVGRLRLFSATNMAWREVRFRKDADCMVCSAASGVRGAQAVAGRETSYA